ncbi:MAG: PEP-CTERM sorting domain-containing protein [Cyanobacteria bacterium J06627_3]
MKIAFSIATLAALSSSLLSAATASAATFTSDFSVTIVEGDFLVGNTFFGQLTYDDSLLNGMGTELIDPNSGLRSLSFDYVAADLSTSATYTDADDDIDSGFPLAIFQDGTLTGLDYSASITSNLVFQFREEPSGVFGFFTDDFSTFESNTGAVAFAEPEPVPEPSALVGLVAIATFAISRRK